MSGWFRCFGRESLVKILGMSTYKYCKGKRNLLRVFCPSLTKLALDLHVKNWMFVCVCVCLCSVFPVFFCNKFSRLLIDSGSGIPLIQDIEPSNSRDRLSHATLRFFSLADQCHTQNLYLRCFKSDFDDVKSNLDLLIE